MLLKILNILSILILLYGMYYVITSIFAFLNLKRNILKTYKPKNKFKILVACRNEEKVIANLIDSINHLNYPKELYSLYVIPNNCTDNTKEVALENGAQIIECLEKTTCKGDALKYTFNLLKKDSFDAYVIFDADNIVDAEFLNKMNNAIEEGYKVAQGFRDSKNPGDNWISGSYSIFYWMQNFFFNKSRRNINKSASINGTGYMVKKEVIDKFGFETKTLTEDIEFTAQCAINNLKIAFVEDAITYDEQPVNFVASWKQRKRWSKGANDCLKMYYKDLIKYTIKNKSMSCVDMLFNFLSPAVQVFGTILMIITLALKVSVSLELGPITWFMFIQLTSIHLTIITYGLNILLNTFLVLYNKKKILRVIPGIFLYSLFILTWIPINFVSIFSKDLKWEQINHTRSMKINDILDN